MARPLGSRNRRKLAAEAVEQSQLNGLISHEMGQKFIDTLFCDARHKALHGGRGSAKSWSVATYLSATSSRKKKRIVCARQFQNSIRDSSKELIEKRIGALGLTPQFDITERYITHRETQSQFLFIGLERNIESIRSLEGADIVWVEEARNTSAKSLEILLPTVRAPESELIWTWNPVDPEDPVDAYFRKGKPPPNSIVTAVSFRDNPFFEQTAMPAELEVLKRGNPARYRHVWEGDYDISYDTKIFTNVRVGRPIVPSDNPPLYGMDFGFSSDPSFVVKLHMLPNRVIYIAREASARVSMDQLPHLITSVTDGDEVLIKADASQPGTIDFLNARGFTIFPAKKGPGSVKSGILFLQGFEIVIDPECKQMREEAHLYSWMTDKLTGKVLPVPVDTNNHGWDAVRYATEDEAIAGALDDDPDGGVFKLRFR